MKVPSGTIKRLTASVFVDGTYRALPKGEREYAARTPEEMQKFDGIIRNALGFDATRGDRLTVENVAFDTSVLDQEKKEMEKSDRMRLLVSVGSRVVTGAVVLFLFLALLRAAKRMRPATAPRGAVGPFVRSHGGRRNLPALPEKLENPRARDDPEADPGTVTHQPGQPRAAAPLLAARRSPERGGCRGHAQR